MLYEPAFQPWFASAQISARESCTVWARCAPCSGRSDETMKSGEPEPLYTVGPQDDDGSGVALSVALRAVPVYPTIAATKTAATPSANSENLLLTNSLLMSR